MDVVFKCFYIVSGHLCNKETRLAFAETSLTTKVEEEFSSIKDVSDKVKLRGRAWALGD